MSAPARDFQLSVIADRIRHYRTLRGLSLQQLSALSGIGRSMLSKIERSEAAPCAIQLKCIADGLGVAVSRLMTIVASREIIHIPRLQQPVFDEGGSGFTSRRLSPARPERDIDWILITLPPNGKTADIDSHRHGLEEYLYLLEGRLGANIDGQLVTLETGDALFFQADTKYSFANLGDAACRYLLIIDSAKVRAAGQGPLR
jgi:transcriptional regulator with XRE-family HTH domain